MRPPRHAGSLCALLFALAVSPGGLHAEINNLNAPHTLCLDLRSVHSLSEQGDCDSNDAECPAGLHCTDNDGNPLNGAVCIEQACVGLGEELIVDVELGETSTPACGAQLFLEWDTAALHLNSVEPDADGELGWPLALLEFIDLNAGTVDLAISLNVGVACNATSGTLGGGTIARLSFTATAPCETFGVRFRDHNPPTKVGGPNGEIPITGCNDEPQPSNIDPVAVEASAQWSCPQITTCSAAHTYAPISIFDACSPGSVPSTADLCTAEHFFTCEQDLDCGFGTPCEAEEDCNAWDRPGFNSLCVPHPDGSAISVCTVDTCTGGLCERPDLLDVNDWLDCSEGCTFPPGLTTITCAYVNGCGYSSECVFNVPVGHGVSHAFCDDGFACTHDLCGDAGCVNTPGLYGDITGDQSVDYADLVCVLDGFRGQFSQTCIRGNCDIGLCNADGTIDLMDIIAALDAFQGVAPCCQDPIGACCTTSGCQYRGADSCSGYYLGDGTDCTTSLCVGACCLDGSCSEAFTQASCLAAGGLYQGDAVLCETVTCPPPNGACCLSGDCQDDIQLSACLAVGGVYHGHQSSCAELSCTAGAHVTISELRVNEPNVDNNEYFELAGLPGASLDGLRYLVIGDGFGGSGEIEVAIGLDGRIIGPDGLFLAAEATLSLDGAEADLTTLLNFENFDNVTHLLVGGFTGSVGMDLDADDDGVLELQPWSEVFDLIAVIAENNPPTTTEFHYGPPGAGPEGAFAPGHVYRCADGQGWMWHVGPFDPTGGLDTPGAANACPAACDDAAECQDGVFCNGQELCLAGYCHAGEPIDCDDNALCTSDYCDEKVTSCQHESIPSCAPWINELHYNDAAAGQDKGIEIAGPAGIDLSGWQLIVYDGQTGTPSGALLLAGIIPPVSNGFGMRWFGFADLQIGTPDGVVLVDDEENVVEFLSYGGVVSAITGPAAGIDSSDISVAESPATPVGSSLQRQGTGTQADDFWWVLPAPHTHGAVNHGQVFAQGCLNMSDCQDDLFCNGQEVCVSGVCLPGANVACNDGIACTIDICDELTDACSALLNHALCDDGLHCNGEEICLAGLGCQPGSAPDCDDGVGCTVDACDENNDTCTSTPDDGLCSDNDFCNGTETCDPQLGCQTGTPLNCPAWINELHYDNDGVDADEGVEVAGPAGTDLTGWTLVAYNGALGGEMYQTVSLSGVVPPLQNGYGVAWFAFPGLQNGGSDGVALVDADQNVLQFISYEGTLVALDGPAAGLLSESIGVSEPPSSPVGFTLQLQGSGSAYGDFTWAAPGPHSRGSINAAQSFE